ncbi:helix-turn-helix transcriptional regulator [Nocardia abscessus]|uniref:helix-turn-helix transcriptional regulator n=1 Tax=Nocardia abscessus TaxID=120957 RepID=UPI002456F28A|nr:hypothetical protein [Nocardia abscessus]
MAEIVRRLIASPLISGADRISAVGLRGHYVGGGKKIRDALAHTAGYDRNAGRLLGTTADGAEASRTHGHVSFESASHESAGVSFDRRNGQQSTTGDEAVAEGHGNAYAATVDLRVEHVAPGGDDTMTTSGGTHRPAADQDIRPNAQTALAHSAKNREPGVPQSTWVPQLPRIPDQWVAFHHDKKDGQPWGANAKTPRLRQQKAADSHLPDEMKSPGGHRETGTSSDGTLSTGRAVPPDDRSTPAATTRWSQRPAESELGPAAQPPSAGAEADSASPYVPDSAGAAESDVPHRPVTDADNSQSVGTGPTVPTDGPKPAGAEVTATPVSDSVSHIPKDSAIGPNDKPDSGPGRVITGHDLDGGAANWSGREIEALHLVFAGLTNVEIAFVLGSTPEAVQSDLIRVADAFHDGTGIAAALERLRAGDANRDEPDSIQATSQPVDLSGAEHTVLLLAGAGLSHKAIGARIGLPPEVVQDHIARSNDCRWRTLVEYKRGHLTNADRCHLLVVSDDNRAAFIGPFHRHDFRDRRSQALLHFADAWLDCVVDADELKIVILLEGYMRGRPPTVQWNSPEEAFSSQMGELSALGLIGQRRGVETDGLEEDFTQQAAALIAAGHDPDAVFAYYVMRMQRQGLQAGDDPRQVLEHAADFWGTRIFGERDDHVDRFERAFSQLFPDWVFDGSFRNDPAEIQRLLDITGSALPEDGNDIHPVKAVALDCHIRRRIFAAATINARIRDGYAVLVSMGDRHLDSIAELVPAWRHRPVAVLDGETLTSAILQPTRRRPTNPPTESPAPPQREHPHVG